MSSFPAPLQDAMSRRGPGVAEKTARVILSQAKQNRRLYEEAAKSYQNNPRHCTRAMNMLYEGLRKGRLMLIPSSAVEFDGMGA